MKDLYRSRREFMQMSWDGLSAITPMERTRKKIMQTRSSSDAPYVFPWHFPNGARSHVNMRIDADWCTREEWLQTMDILSPLAEHASWYVTTGKIADENLDLLKMLQVSGSEIGSHMHHHFTFRDYANNKHNIQRAHDWLALHNIECRSFVSPSAKWNKHLQRCIDEMGYVYSSEFGLAHDCLPFSMPSGTLQIPVHPVSPGNFAVKDGMDRYYIAVIDALYDACLPVHLYAHPHDVRYMGRNVIEYMCSLPDTHTSTLLEYALWWKNRTCEINTDYDAECDTWKINWSGSDGVWLAVSWDGIHHTLVQDGRVQFRTKELPDGKSIVCNSYSFPASTPVHRRNNLRSTIGLWLDLEYIVPPEDYKISSLKTCANYFIKRLRA